MFASFGLACALSPPPLERLISAFCGEAWAFVLLWQEGALVFVWELDGGVCRLVDGALSLRWYPVNVLEKKDLFGC